MTRTTHLVIALAFLAGCGGAKPAATATGGPPILAKKVAVSWGIERANAEMEDIFLATTDETGKQVSHPLGRYKGDCAVVTPLKMMNAVSAVDCRTGGTGTELQAVIQNGESIVVFKLGIDQGVTPDPMAREEVTRVEVPRGAKIEASN